ncbi:MAG: CARDB domain-containing protein [bacterium]
MNQDNDNDNGEIDDKYSCEFTIDATGPRILSHSLSGIHNVAVREIDITFNEKIASATFTEEAVTIMGPEGALEVTDVSAVTPYAFRIALVASLMDGAYQVTIAPVMTDEAGNFLDQDEDGAQGESDDDSYEIAFVQELPDLIVTEISHPIEARANTHIEIIWSVTNSGEGHATNSWIDAIYLSEDATLSPHDSVIGEAQYTQDLAFGESYTRTITAAVPDGIEGQRWIILKTNSTASLDENGSGKNNIMVATPPLWVTDRPYPDLRVTEMSAPESLSAGEIATFSWTVANGGNAATSATGWHDKLYLSLDTTIGPGDIELATMANVDFLAAGESYTQTKDSMIPESVPQNFYYILVKTDTNDAVEEFDQENNNTIQSLSSVEVTIPPPAFLDVINVEVSSPQVTAGQTVGVTWTVENTGGRTITFRSHGPWDGIDHAIAFSENDIFEGSEVDRVLCWHQAGWNGTLSPGGQYTVSYTVKIPRNVSEGTYYLFPWPDPPLWTGLDKNLRAAPISVIIPAPDLHVSSLNVPSSGLSGQKITISWAVKNMGDGNPGSIWDDTIFLSADQILDDGDYELGSVAHTALLPPTFAYTVDSYSINCPGGIEGSYYLLIQTDKNNAVAEHDEENNIAVSETPISITLIESDLQVQLATSPATGEATQPITVEWTVINAGSETTAVSSWVDKVYCSVDEELLPEQDRLIGEVPHVTVLGAGSTYNNAKEFLLPQDLEGTYYIFVMTDTENELYEHNAENNNVFRVSQTIAIHNTSPDLHVAAFSAPSTGIAGQTIDVSWTVANAGGAPAFPDWQDAIYLSKDNSFEHTDDVLGTFIHSVQLNPGESYGPQAPVGITLPGRIAGSYYLFFSADNGASVYEKGNEADNINGPHLITITDVAPDLVLTHFNAPSAGIAGEAIQLEWSITNEGTAIAAAEWQDALYLSEDEIFDRETDTLLAQFERTEPLATGASYEPEAAAQQVLIPDLTDHREGDYYLFFCLDCAGTLYEKASGEENNISAPQLITLTERAPDLQILNASAPEEAVAGGAIEVDWRIINNGDSAATEWEESFYLSEDAEFNLQDDRLCALFSYTEALKAGKKTGPPVKPALVRIPARITGTYYLFIVTDKENAVYEKEAGEANNLYMIPHSIHVIIQPADLQVTEVNVAPTAVAGAAINIQWTVTNRGAHETDETFWKDGVYLSTDSEFDPASDIRVGFVEHSGVLPVGESYSQSASLVIRQDLAGAYHLYVVTDALHQAYEYDKDDNNISASPGTIEISGIRTDLHVSAFTVPESATQGSPVEITWEVTNEGIHATSGTSWDDTLYLSSDAILDGDDHTLGTFKHQASLENGAHYSVKKTVNLPRDMIGDFYVIVKADSSPFNDIFEYEAEENNTSSASLAIGLAPTADLTVANITFPSSAWSGQGMIVDWTVANESSVATEAERGFWDDTLFLSRDPYLDLDTDISLGSIRRQGDLDPGASISQSLEVKLPDWVSGPYYLIAFTDSANHVYERDLEYNNAQSSEGTLHINLTPPADLVVESITPPDAGIYGETATWTYEVKNIGDLPARGTWYDTLYLSTDQQWDLHDSRIARVYHEQGDMEPDDICTEFVTVPFPGVVPGEYYIIASADILDDVRETDNTNNTKASIVRVSVEGRELELNTALSGAIARDQFKYYQITMDAGLDLVITVSDAARATTELYVASGRIPTRSDYDVKGEENNSGNLQARILGTYAATYYILLYGYNCPDPAPSFELLASLPPHSIDGLSVAQGGNSGEVTVEVEGFNFTHGTKAYLKDDDGNIIAEGTVYYKDTGTLSVTFDLAGKPVGNYHIELENPNGSIAGKDFAIVEGEGGDLYSQLLMPNLVRGGRSYTLTLEYGNMGDTDIPAPLFTVSVEDGALIRLNPSDEFKSDSISVLGIADEDPVDILPPGSLFTIEMEFMLTDNRATVPIYLGDFEDFEDPINWDELDIRPEDMNADEWDPLWARFKAQIGTTWGDYVAMLQDNARYLGTLGDHVYDAKELLAFEVLQTTGLGAPKTLVEKEDAFCAAPGLPLSFKRIFLDAINYRNRLSAFGRGWTHSYNITLEEQTDGGIVINGPDGFDRRFDYQGGEVVSSGFQYKSQIGDYATLVKQSDGSFLLAEKEGIAYTFNANGQLEYIEDRNNNRITMVYDVMGLLIKIQHSNGYSFSLEYNADGRIVKLIDHAERTIQYHYDDPGEHLVSVDAIGDLTTTYTYEISDTILINNSLKSITYPDDTGVEYGYDDFGRLISQVDSEGTEQAHYSYGSAGRVRIFDSIGDITTIYFDRNGSPARTQSPLGAITIQDFNPAFGITKIVNPLGSVTTFDYDTNGNQIRITDPLGHMKTMTYTSDNLVEMITDEHGGTTTYEYDSSGNMITEIDALGNVTFYTYDEFGNRTSITNALGNTTFYEYDAMGYPTRIIDPKGAEIILNNDAVGNLISFVNAKGNTWQYQYDALDRIITIINPLENESAFTYNSNGNILSREDAKGAIHKYEHDIHGNLVKRTDPLRNITTYAYDARGNRTSITDAKGNITSYDYDLGNRLIKITDALQGVTSFTYDENGNPSSITDEKDQVTRFTYDRLDRKISMINPLEEQETYGYDNVGNLIRKTLFNGDTTEYEYDSLGRLIKKILQGSDTITYTYDSVGNRIGITNPYSLLSFEYDENSQLVRVHAAGTDYQPETIISYSYDKNGNRESMIDSFGGVTNYSYNELDNLTALTSSNSDPIKFTYDKNGQRIAKILPHNLQTLYNYNLNEELILLANKLGEDVDISNYNYGYDTVGNRISMTDSSGQHNYTYDNLYQLLQADHPQIQAESFSYDPVGNRLISANSSGWDHDAGNKLLNDGDFTYQYINGCLTQKVSISTGDVTTYTYNSENQLIGITTPDYIISYYYDGLGRRICKEINGLETYYVYDDEDILLILDNSCSIVSQYTHGPGIDEPIKIEQGDASYYYITDGLGSIVQIADSTGNIIQEYTYDSFGNIVHQSGDLINPYTYTGREYDPESGLYYYRARYYDAKIGRFLSQDPIGFGSGDLNLYRYVNNNPVNWIDPYGLSYLEYNSNTLNLYSSSGNLIGTYPAGNNASNSWAPGTYSFDYWKPHFESNINDAYGEFGNFVFNVPGRSGMGVHSGRYSQGGPNYGTLGCIRTTHEGHKAIMNTHFGIEETYLQIDPDPLTHIIVLGGSCI